MPSRWVSRQLGRAGAKQGRGVARGGPRWRWCTRSRRGLSCAGGSWGGTRRVGRLGEWERLGEWGDSVAPVSGSVHSRACRYAATDPFSGETRSSAEHPGNRPLSLNPSALLAAGWRGAERLGAPTWWAQCGLAGGGEGETQVRQSHCPPSVLSLGPLSHCCWLLSPVPDLPLFWVAVLLRICWGQMLGGVCYVSFLTCHLKRAPGAVRVPPMEEGFSRVTWPPCGDFANKDLAVAGLDPQAL